MRLKQSRKNARAGFELRDGIHQFKNTPASAGVFSCLAIGGFGSRVKHVYD